jgi:hypothetical protein
VLFAFALGLFAAWLGEASRKSSLQRAGEGLRGR